MIKDNGMLRVDIQDFIDLGEISQDTEFNTYPGKGPRGWGKLSTGVFI